MTTQFVFRIDEKHLRIALDNIEHQKALYSEQSFGLEISIDLIPDGIGYDACNLQVKVTSDETTGCTAPMAANEFAPSPN